MNPEGRELPRVLRDRLSALVPQDQLRSLQSEADPEGRALADFTSNDYLGFARDPDFLARVMERLRERLARSPIRLGAGGSRLLRGNPDVLSETEEQLARFCGAETALLLPSGYQANLALLSSLLRPGDQVFSDAANHASLIDGIRLSGATKHIFPHRDLTTLRALLMKSRELPGLKVVVTESLFSMEGTLAPLTELAAVAEEFGAELVVDEAHATGIFGCGSGSCLGGGGGRVDQLGLRPQILATTHTGGKAFGSAGAWIAGPSRLKDYLLNFARPAIFSTAPLPALAIQLLAALEHWHDRGRARVLELRRRIQAFREESGLEPLDFSPIIPVIFGSNSDALEASQALRARGFDVRAIRPPTVPEGTARLRLVLSSACTEALTRELARAVARLSISRKGDVA